jgi:hypothetical protein
MVRNEPGMLEHRELLDDRRHRHVKRFRELRHRCRTRSQALGDRAARRIRQRGEDSVEAMFLILHQSVKYSGRSIHSTTEALLRYMGAGKAKAIADDLHDRRGRCVLLSVQSGPRG